MERQPLFPQLPPSGITTDTVKYDFSRIKLKPVQMVIVFYEYFLYNINILISIVAALITTIREQYFSELKTNDNFLSRLDANMAVVNSFDPLDLVIVPTVTIFMYIGMIKCIKDLIYLKKRYGYDPTKFPIGRLFKYMFYPLAKTQKEIDSKSGHKIHVYVQDFATYQPSNPICTVSIGSLLRFARETIPSFSSDALKFLRKISLNTGLGPATYVSEECRLGKYDFEGALAETSEVLTTVVKEVLEKANVDPTEIDYLVTNSSLFNPTPSLSALIVNHFSMRKNIKTASLGGMGCSGSMVGMDCAKDALTAMITENNMKTTVWQKNKKGGYKKRPFYALVVCTENITMNWYRGSNKSMLIPNSLFRLGGAAILLSSERNPKTKYRLCHLIRTHHGSIPDSYNAVIQRVDDQGLLGVLLTKGVPKAGGKVVSDNITTLYNAVLPLDEKIKYVWYNIILRKIIYNIRDSIYVNKQKKLLRKKYPNGIPEPMQINEAVSTCLLNKDLEKKSNNDEDSTEKTDSGEGNSNPYEIKHLPKPDNYIPNITKKISHFCFHTGGRAVLDNMCTTLKLDESKLAASRAALYRYGNTSSSSVWYELAYHESTKALQVGEWVWQIAFGSGFKCASCIWEVLPGAIKRPTLFDRFQPNFTYSKDNCRPCYISKEEEEMDYDKFIIDEKKKYRVIHFSDILSEWSEDIQKAFNIQKEEYNKINEEYKENAQQIKENLLLRNEKHTKEELSELREQKLIFSELLAKNNEKEENNNIQSIEKLVTEN